jgi:hypothetical protein
MQRPDQTLIDLRPLVPTEIDKASEIEQFQNDILRPILKFQHELFIAESRSNQILNRFFQKCTCKVPHDWHGYWTYDYGRISEVSVA